MDQVMVARLMGQAAFKLGKVEALREVLAEMHQPSDEPCRDCTAVEEMLTNAIEELNVTIGTVRQEVES